MSEVNLENATKEQLLTAAEKLGLAIDGRLGVDKIREEIAAELEVRKEADIRAAANAQRIAEEEAAAKEAPVEDEIKSPVEVTKMPSLADAMLTKEVADAGPETEGQKKNRLRREAMALVRVRVSCMDPQKKNLKGELICVSNKNFGTVQRFIPFNREWHIEKVLYDILLDKEYMVFDREKTGRAGIEVVTPRNVPAFNIQVLPPLSKGELKDLAQRQAMADGTRQE
jgi:hypothetical protein